MSKVLEFLERSGLQSFGLLAACAVSFIWITPAIGWACLGAFVWSNGTVIKNMIQEL